MNSYTWAPGHLINQAQTTFVGLLRVLSIPIVILLGLASGYTTYYGMSYFITPWIALIITIAVQSIIVICSLEIASIHWRANPLRYLLVSVTLVVSVSVSVSFSYFKFYEISEKESIELQRLAVMTGMDNVFIARPRRFFRVGKAWRHHLDTARDALVSAICSKVLVPPISPARIFIRAPARAVAQRRPRPDTTPSHARVASAARVRQVTRPHPARAALLRPYLRPPPASECVWHGR